MIRNDWKDLVHQNEFGNKYHQMQSEGEKGITAGQGFELMAGAGQELKDLYFFYTTCPKCAKTYGKNYVVGFAKVA